MTELGFPAWLRATHYLNILFLTLLMRSGLEVLSAHPKLYWKDSCLPESEWLKFTRKKLPKGELWTSKDEEESFSPIIALPGHKNLGLGRHWHFLAVLGWVATGLSYVVLLFVTPEWQRLVPTSWDVFPQAWPTLLSYLSLHLPPPGNPYNALQQLTYAGVVFLLTPFTIASGAAMSPALGAHFPLYVRLFGGHQAARSLHFLCLAAFTAFTVVHLAMVVAHGLPEELAKMVLGSEHDNTTLAVVIAVVGLAIVVVVHVAGTLLSLRQPRKAQELLGSLIDPLEMGLLHRLTSRQHYKIEDISPFFRVNGRPPQDEGYKQLADTDFKNWSLDVKGLVEKPVRLTLDELAAMERQTQITKHRCIQGWSAIGSWTGVPLSCIMALCRPQPSARYIVFYALDEKSVEHGPEAYGRYYETIDLELANHPQTILAYEMNGKPLPTEHGAPLRLRVETQLGFKMVKYIQALEFVADYQSIGQGQGGWREDFQHYSSEASI